MSMIGRDPYAYMPELETPRLRLRKLTMRDARDVFAYSRDPEVARHVLWDAHRSIGESRAYIRYMQRKYRMGEAASWGIEWKESGRIIGTIGFMWIHFEHATEALREVIRYAFETLRLNRVEAIHEVDNPASGAVMRKCGMRHEGCLRQKLRNKGRYVDVDLYAILRADPRPAARTPR